jgi:hypothetical protein
LALSFRELLTRFYHKESSSPHQAIVPIEGAVLFELYSNWHMAWCMWPSMRKAVLAISGNVYKQQEMEIDKLINDV